MLATAINVSRLGTLVIHARTGKTTTSTDCRPSIFGPPNFAVKKEDIFILGFFVVLIINRSSVRVSKKKIHVIQANMVTSTRVSLLLLGLEHGFPFFPRGASCYGL